ncbi:MAG: hypothetical protein EOO45_20310 [Flavobacterium sp.]|nr:MAG: hypothetical protein EOO45_20310 [Flavobacterium sp.]
MKKITIKKFYAAAVFCFLLPIGAMAQDEGFDDGDGDGDDVDDEVAMPIDNNLLALLVSGCALGYVLLRKGEKLNAVK